MNLLVTKIKAFWSASGALVLGVVGPIVAAIAYVSYLLSKNRELETEIQAKDGDNKLEELKGEQKNIDTGASASVLDYQRIRDAYLRKYNNSLRSGNQGSESSSADSGRGDQSGGGDAKNPGKAD